MCKAIVRDIHLYVNTYSISQKDPFQNDPNHEYCKIALMLLNHLTEPAFEVALHQNIIFLTCFVVKTKYERAVVIF